VIPVEESEPYAEITRAGRLVYHINIIDGISGMNSPWIAFGRSHAEKRARRKLAWYKRKYGPPRERWEIRGTA
jgi:hypothetical protein